tara:strand:+ start:199 stop:474 length:276 start_codon:yes stop_codon:yes gene_type:complete
MNDIKKQDDLLKKTEIQIGKHKFKVELVNDPNTKQATYILEGNRQSKYGLIRNTHQPELLFAYNLKGFDKQAKVAGYTWFTDKNGKLEPVG